MKTIRKLKVTELPILSQLFNYKDFDDMITENTRNIESDIVDIFVLFDELIAFSKIAEKKTYEETAKRLATIVVLLPSK